MNSSPSLHHHFKGFGYFFFHERMRCFCWGEVEVRGVLIHLLLRQRDLLSCFSFQAHFFQISAGFKKINQSRRMLETLTFQFRKTWRFFSKFTAISCEGIWVFPKIGGFPPKGSISIGFSIIFTIHFWGPIPIFGNTPL